MMMMKNKLLFYVSAFMLLTNIGWAQNLETRLTATFEEETQIATNGLHFAEKRQFGPRITPYGDCIDVVNGYVFAAWYRGDMNDRSLMLSRKNLNVPGSDWVTIQFPHKHVGFRYDTTKGDSHNTISIGISTFDNKIHMIYDMHAYTTSDFANDYFNYSVSSAGGAFVPDAEFNLSLFENENTLNAKVNYLKQGVDYQVLTYPEIHRTPDGNLVVTYRYGGAGNGDRLLAYYDENGWTDNWKLSRGRFSSPTYSMYGYSKFQFGKYYFGFAIRDYQSQDYDLNQGLYFISADATPTGPSTTWSDANGNPISIPFATSVEDLKIGMPQDFTNETVPRTPSNPAFVVTESGAIHLLARGGSRDVHFYRGPNDTEFSTSTANTTPYLDIRGDIFSYKDHVFVIQLVGSKLTIKTTKEGTDNWITIHEEGDEDLRYKYFEAVAEDDKLYVYLMEQGTSETLPLYLKEFTLSEELIDTSLIPDFTIESENFSSKDGYALVLGNEFASNGRYIGELRDNTTVTYNFNLGSLTSSGSGTYDFKILASNQDTDNATMNITINGQTYSGVPIARTNDWNVFQANTIEGVQLVAGSNTVVIEQVISAATRPDVMQFFKSESLSSDEFTKDDVVIYPNPSNGVFNVETSLDNPNYRLMSMQGKVLKTGKLEQKQLNFSSYSRGVYFLEMSSNGKRIVEKILIK